MSQTLLKISVIMICVVINNVTSSSHYSNVAIIKGVTFNLINTVLVISDHFLN